MKLGMTRWNVVPLYKGRRVGFPVRGSVHVFVPPASPTKLFTANGDCFSKSCTVISPIEVLMVA